MCRVAPLPCLVIMADKMSMSLDDIVKMSRASKADKESGGGGKAKKGKPSREDKKPYDKEKDTKKDKPKKERPPPKEASPNESVFVGNLSFTADAAALKAHLSTVASCSVDIKLRKNAKSAGFAIATFEDVESATKAVNELHDVEFEERKLIVRFDNSAKAE